MLNQLFHDLNSLIVHWDHPINGNKWLTLNKRLFLRSGKEDDPSLNCPRNEEYWPIMSLDELKDGLASDDIIPFEELQVR